MSKNIIKQPHILDKPREHALQQYLDSKIAECRTTQKSLSRIATPNPKSSQQNRRPNSFPSIYKRGHNTKTEKCRCD